MAVVPIERFVEDFTNELRQRNAAIFAGAGLSVPAGFVDWKGLLKPLADELRLDVDREYDLVKIAQYHVNHHNNRSDITDAVLNNFSTRDATITVNHRILARLPISPYWTTNFDPTIENALREAGKIVDVKHTSDHLVHTLQGRDAIIYKMHGDYSDPAHAVLCKEDYEKYHLDRGDFLTALAGDLLSKMFLFIGFSFSDPNLDYVLGRLHTRHGKNQRKHYCFVRREPKQTEDGNDDFNYRLAKQDYFIRDLERYNIRAVLVDTYADITKVLHMVEARFKSKTVFVSGAAHEYGGEWSSDEALDFVHKFSQALIEKDFKIVTGLGLGIGSTVVDGALQQIYHVQKRALSDQLVIRPFPQSVDGQRLWRQYREDMLDFAGLAVFMFGNKLDTTSDCIIESTGVNEEFEIAHTKGIKVLPLGFTGYVSRLLYERVKADFSTYYPNATATFQQLFTLLGDQAKPINEQLITTIAALVELQKM